MDTFVASVNLLNKIDFDENSIKKWESSPSLFQHKGKKAKNNHTLKKMCRNGIPPILRSAIWLTSVVRTARPSQSLQETYEYGVVRKAEVLNHGYDVVLKNVFPHKSDEEAAVAMPPRIGIPPDEVKAFLIDDHCDPKKVEIGLETIIKVVYALHHHVGIDYCPLLCDLVALFLSVMPESYTYAAIREMSNVHDFYFPVSKIEHHVWCKTFADLMRKLSHKTAVGMDACGALAPDSLNPILCRCFVNILKREDVLRIIDIYTIEGYKALFRIGIMVLRMSTEYMELSDFINVDSFWGGVKKVAHSDKFQFDVVIKRTYGENKYHNRQLFPRRKFITQLMSSNEEWAERYSPSQSLNFCQRPLGFIEGNIPIVLAKQSSSRLALAEFLPSTFKNTKVELIYSSNFHGRSLAAFYNNCARSKHTITLIELLQTGGVIGMFATDTWHCSRKTYGDGGCMLFRLAPNPACYHWCHGIHDSSILESNKLISEVLSSQFMISTDNFIAMGSNEDGCSGLRLNEDLSKGSSSKARGFENEPLGGEDYLDFDIGVVEVYHLVR